MDRIQSILADSETLIIFVLVCLATILLATIVSRSLRRILLRRVKDEQIDVTSFFFLRHIVVAIIYFFGFAWAFLTLPISRNFAHSLFAGAGLSTIILGIASQQILGNLMSGVLIIMKRPFRINDLIEVQGKSGRVIELDLFTTVIVDDAKNRIMIPNSILANNIIINFSKGA